MYKLAADFDASFFLGATLEMVCFNANQIYFHFDRKISVVAESSFLFVEAGNSVERKISVPAIESSLMALLEQTITQARADNLGTLTVEFVNGAMLKFLDTSEHYESYKIVQGDTETIV